MKKLFYFAVLFVIITAVLSACGKTEKNTTINGGVESDEVLKYRLVNDEYYEVCGIVQDISEVEKVTIPEKFNGIPVKRIGNEAFLSCASLTEIIIPNSVTSIGDWAFSGCLKLTEITIPNSVTSIGDGAFSGCFNLTEITIPNSVTRIGVGVFVFTNLTEITVDENNMAYKTVNGVLFTKDEKTILCYLAKKEETKYEIPSSVMKIDSFAFYYCSKLTEITIPNSVTRIGVGVFAFTNLTEITVDENNMAYKAVNGVLFTKDEKTILCYPAKKEETKYEIPSSVTKIDSYAFYNCSNLTEITIPNSVTSIGDYAFYNCSNLTEITIPDSVTSIGVYAFYNCSSLTEITIPNSVTSIGDWAFSGCSNLTEITIPNNVTSIGDRAFYKCSNLTEITIPNSVTSIGDWAFSGCFNLTEITIPNSVTRIGVGVFAFTNLTEITVDENNMAYKAVNGVLFTKDEKTILCYLAKKEETKYEIPSSITKIDSYAFSGCSNLTEITIPNSVTSIGTLAFMECNKLTIYCEAKSKPESWNGSWNPSNCPVVWGYKDE